MNLFVNTLELSKALGYKRDRLGELIEQLNLPLYLSERVLGDLLLELRHLKLPKRKQYVLNQLLIRYQENSNLDLIETAKLIQVEYQLNEILRRWKEKSRAQTTYTDLETIRKYKKNRRIRKVVKI